MSSVPFLEQAALGGYKQGVARKEQLTDEQHALKRNAYLDERKNYRDQYNALKDENGNIKPENQAQADKIMAGLTQNEYNIGQLYDPIKAPGRLQQDWHYLRDKIHGIKQSKTPSSITTQTPAMTIPSATGPISTPELPAYQQVTPRLPSQGGNVTTQQPGVAATTGPGMNTPAPLLVTQSFGNDPVPGMVVKGNIDLSKRPNIDNGDGTHSSTFSMGFGTDNGVVTVPGVGDGTTYPLRQLRVLYTLPDGSQKWAVPGNQPYNWIAPKRPTPQNNEALNQYLKTGKNFGTFKDDKTADAYGKTLHEDQEKYGNNGVTAHPVSPSGNITIPAGPPVTVTKAPTPSWGQAQVLKQKAAAMQKAQQEAGLLAAGAPLSQGQQENALLQSRLQAIDANKSLSPDEKAEARRKLFGVGEKPIFKEFQLPNGLHQWFDVSRPDLIPEGATSIGADNADTRKRADYQAYLAKNPDYEKNGGTFEKWVAEQAGLGRSAVAAAKPPNRDDRYIAILQKQQNGKLTPDDIAYKAAYDLWVDRTKVAPGVARMAAMNDDRYVWVYNQNDPNKELHPMRMKDAMNAPVGSPQSIAFKTDAAITKYMTSGQGATNINYFNTAMDHLKVLQEAGENLNNGNIQGFNNLAQQFGIATGQPQAVEFNAVKSAVAGELSKTFKGTGATDAEIADINQTINAAQSPEQIRGAIDYYIRLMGGKMSALEGQYTQGKQGVPNFPGTTPNAPTASQYVYAKDPQGKVHRAKAGTALPKGWTVTNGPAAQ
jgi:hypothetical protein